VILQAVGGAREIHVDLTYQALRRGDTVILCSDGLYSVISVAELAESVDRTQNLEVLCQELVDLANTRGGPDNVTVVAAHVDGPGLEEPTTGDPVGRQVLSFDEI